MTGAAKRIVLETLGWVLLLLGIAAIFLPGPGLLGIFAGLALLSQQYDWAERRVEPVRLRALLRCGRGRRDLAPDHRLVPRRPGAGRLRRAVDHEAAGARLVAAVRHLVAAGRHLDRASRRSAPRSSRLA